VGGEYHSANPRQLVPHDPDGTWLDQQRSPSFDVKPDSRGMGLAEKGGAGGLDARGETGVCAGTSYSMSADWWKRAVARVPELRAPSAEGGFRSLQVSSLPILADSTPPRILLRQPGTQLCTCSFSQDEYVWAREAPLRPFGSPVSHTSESLSARPGWPGCVRPSTRLLATQRRDWFASSRKPNYWPNWHII
jgi:hypothetical protein